MKGTLVLISGETVNNRKAWLWSSIHLDQEIIKRFQQSKFKDDPDFRESIKLTQLNIKSTYTELKDLVRWAKSEGIGDDEPYVYPSVRARWEAMSDDEKEAEAIRLAEVQQQIWDLKNAIEFKDEGEKKGEG